MLAKLVEEFGVLALGLWPQRLDPQGQKMARGSGYHYRVSDVLLCDGRGVTRSGPHAEKVGRVMSAGSSAPEPLAQST